MRDNVAGYLRQQLPGFRIVHELVMGHVNRADIAAIGGDRLIAVELKSSRDVLKRAEKQIKTFSSLAHAAILVLDQKFFDRAPYNNGAARCVAPDNIARSNVEIWHYPQPGPDADLGGGSMYRWRMPRPNLHQPHARLFLSLLWRAELVEEAKRHGIDATRKMDMVTIAAAMAWRMTGKEIAEAVCRQLRARRFPEADPRRRAAPRRGVCHRLA
ncbi:MAG: hypothetical protein KGL39_06540 [Patescibacteria group bacterium]|nr:hypothetical protein [Patescibacteria group bacterium]